MGSSIGRRSADRRCRTVRLHSPSAISRKFWLHNRRRRAALELWLPAAFFFDVDALLGLALWRRSHLLKPIVRRSARADRYMKRYRAAWHQHDALLRRWPTRYAWPRIFREHGVALSRRLAGAVIGVRAALCSRSNSADDFRRLNRRGEQSMS